MRGDFSLSFCHHTDFCYQIYHLHVSPSSMPQRQLQLEERVAMPRGDEWRRLKYAYDYFFVFYDRKISREIASSAVQESARDFFIVPFTRLRCLLSRQISVTRCRGAPAIDKHAALYGFSLLLWRLAASHASALRCRACAFRGHESRFFRVP